MPRHVMPVFQDMLCRLQATFLKQYLLAGNTRSASRQVARPRTVLCLCGVYPESENLNGEGTGNGKKASRAYGVRCLIPPFRRIPSPVNLVLEMSWNEL